MVTDDTVHIYGIRTGTKCFKVQVHNMPAGNTLVQDVGGGSGTTVHRKEDGAPQAVEKTGPLLGLLSATYRGFDDGA